jgi:hypothetical protein
MGQNIVKRLDHVTVRVANPNPLFAALTQQLLLPEAWPVTTNPFFTTGGIHLGNANLEVLYVGNERAPARLYGLAFELEPFPKSLPALDEAQITHTPPAPFFHFDEQGWQSVARTNVYLGGLISRTFLKRIFFAASQRLSRDTWEQGFQPSRINRRFSIPLLHKWVYPDGMVSAVEYNPVWAAKNIQAPTTRVGLEVNGIYEIVVGTPSFSKVYPRWKRLLESHREVVEAVWRLPGNLHIRLVPASSGGLQSMTWQVESLNRAAQFLYKRELLGDEKDKTVAILPEKVFGLDIRLIQA